MIFSVLVASVLAIASAAPAKRDQGIVVPIRREGESATLGLTVARYQTAIKSGSPVSPLVNGGEGNYFFADIQFGDSPTTSRVVFDTGSSDTWAIGSECTADAKAGCSPNETGSVKVDGSFKSLKAKGQTLYGDGSYGVDYNIYSTNVAYGGVTAKNLPVGIVTYDFGGVKIPGILGMGWNSISNVAKALKGANANFLDATGYSTFGMYINPSTSVDGEVSFGFYDSSMYSGDFQWFPVSSFTDPNGNNVANGWWQFAANVLTFSQGTNSYDYGNDETSTPNGVSIADSGTPELLLTDAAASAINQWFNPNYDPNSNTVPCKGKSLVLTFTAPDGTVASYSIAYNLLVQEQNGACQSLVTGGAEKLGFTIFGAPFYQAAYTAYDKTNNRIGFAQLKGSVPNPPIPSTTAVPPAPTTSTKAPRVSTTIAPKCNHDECSVGAFLHAGCSKCADEVCAQDSYCCNNKWDDSCVNEVN
ncbi:aspartic peptidase domain-containing protein, partial [Chytriomyces sp. MP71]